MAAEEEPKKGMVVQIHPRVRLVLGQDVPPPKLPRPGEPWRDPPTPIVRASFELTSRDGKSVVEAVETEAPVWVFETWHRKGTKEPKEGGTDGG